MMGWYLNESVARVASLCWTGVDMGFCDWICATEESADAVSTVSEAPASNSFSSALAICRVPLTSG